MRQKWKFTLSLILWLAFKPLFHLSLYWHIDLKWRSLDVIHLKRTEELEFQKFGIRKEYWEEKETCCAEITYQVLVPSVNYSSLVIPGILATLFLTVTADVGMRKQGFAEFQCFNTRTQYTYINKCLSKSNYNETCQSEPTEVTQLLHLSVQNVPCMMFL